MNRKKYAISVICTYAGKHNVKLGEKWTVLFPHSSRFHIILLFLRLFFNLAGLSVLNWLLVSLCYKSPIHPFSNVLVNLILCVCARACACVYPLSHSRIGLFACQTPLSMDFSGKNTGVGCHFLLQRIFLIQGLNRIFCTGRQILYHRSHLGRFYVVVTEIKYPETWQQAKISLAYAPLSGTRDHIWKQVTQVTG